MRENNSINYFWTVNASTISSYHFDCAQGKFVSLSPLAVRMDRSLAGCTKESYKFAVGRVCIHEIVLLCFYLLYLFAKCYGT